MGVDVWQQSSHHWLRFLNWCEDSSRMVVTKEVTRGTFDPRTYKDDDPVNWARKRKPEWMATTGKIHYVRERTVESQERELEEQRKAQAAQDEACQELKAEVQEDPAPVPVKVEIAPKKQPVQWVGRKRSDITRDGGFMGYFGRTV